MLPLDKPFIYQGVSYRTSEHFYQAMKLPKDRVDLRAQIAGMNQYQAKLAIRDRDKYKWRDDWKREMSLEVMEYILRIKFKNGTSWAAKLAATGDELIVEFNNWGMSFGAGI